MHFVSSETLNVVIVGFSAGWFCVRQAWNQTWCHRVTVRDMPSFVDKLWLVVLSVHRVDIVNFCCICVTICAPVVLSSMVDFISRCCGKGPVA